MNVSYMLSFFYLLLVKHYVCTCVLFAPEDISVVVEGSCEGSGLRQGIQVGLQFFCRQPTTLKSDPSAPASEQTLQSLHMHTMKTH